MFKLRLPARDLKQWAEMNKDMKYLPFQQSIGPAVAIRGHMERDEFLALCKWKSPRTKHHCASNRDSFIRIVTSTALSAKDERLRIEVLTLLTGVNWPTASVILHYCSKDRYPILDFRALWSLSIDKPPTYSFDFWWEYTISCRQLANDASLSMRDLDRALWQFSLKNQTKQRRPLASSKLSV